MAQDKNKLSETQSSLQELNQEKQKKDAANEANKKYCKTCKKEIRQCFGHGSGDEEEAELKNLRKLAQEALAAEEAEQEAAMLPRRSKISRLPAKEEEEQALNTLSPEELLYIPEKLEEMDAKLLGELLANEVFFIQNDASNGVFRVDANLNALYQGPDREQRVCVINQLIRFIEREFDLFKEENPKLHESKFNKEVTTRAVGDACLDCLCIKINSIDLYDSFMGRLSGMMNLLQKGVEESLRAFGLDDEPAAPTAKKHFHPKPSPYKDSD